MDTNTKNTTQSTNTAGNTASRNLLVIVPGMVQGDAHTAQSLNQAFNGIGTLLEVSPGIYAVSTQKDVTSWADQVRGAVNRQFYIVPVDVNAFHLFRAYLPDGMKTMAGTSIRAA